MLEKFRRSIDFTLRFEGGYVNHPNDPGGETNRGITKGTLQRAYSCKLVNHCSVRDITREDAENIYQALYWNPCCADKIPEPLCTFHFDAAVNHGVGGAGRLLQKTLNNYAKKALIPFELKVDGAVGDKTLEALDVCIKKANNLPLICEIYLNEREKFFRNIVNRRPQSKVFLNGWLNRVNANRRYLHEWFE